MKDLKNLLALFVLPAVCGTSLLACAHSKSSSSAVPPSATELAQSYEQKWRQTKSAQYLYEAGKAYDAAGYRAYAIARWRQYLSEESQLSPQLSSEVEKLIVGAKQHTASVKLHIGSEKIPPKGFVAQLTYLSPTEAVRSALQLTLHTNEHTLELDPGEWELQIVAPGFQRFQERRKIVQGVDLKLWNVAPEPTQSPVPVQLQVGPQAAMDAGMTVEFIADSETSGETKFYQINQATASLKLTPGVWKVRVQASGYETFVEELTVRQESSPVVRVNLSQAIVVKSSRKSSPSLLTLGLIGGSLVPTGVGLGLTIVWSSYFEKVRQLNHGAFVAAEQQFPDAAPSIDVNTENSPQDSRSPVIEAKYPVAVYHTQLANSIDWQGVSIGLMASGVGFWVAGLVDYSHYKTKLWWGEAGLGGLLAIGGSIWASQSNRRMAQGLRGLDRGGPWRVSDKEAVAIRNNHIGAAALLGGGLGMITGAGIGLLTDYMAQKRHKKSKKSGHVQSYWNGQEMGLVWRQQF